VAVGTTTGEVVTMVRAWVMLLSALIALTAATTADAGKVVVRNACRFTVWMEQLNVPNAPKVAKIAAGRQRTYRIPEGETVSAMRWWPKRGCDKDGENCAVGQSMAPCPAGGCAPPIDSKLEATWCVGDACETFFNLSMVDGYTLPVSMRPKAPDNISAGCKPAACPSLSTRADVCPTDEDLSTDGQFPALAHQDLRMRDPVSGKVTGCFSPCGKLTYAKAYGGHEYKPQDPQAAYYCCKGVADTPEVCGAGPVRHTSYARLIDEACRRQVYGWAYDDANGTHTCTGDLTIVLTICPKG
jgi:hypothetical protein